MTSTEPGTPGLRPTRQRLAVVDALGSFDRLPLRAGDPRAAGPAWRDRRAWPPSTGPSSVSPRRARSTCCAPRTARRSTGGARTPTTTTWSAAACGATVEVEGPDGRALDAGDRRRARVRRRQPHPRDLRDLPRLPLTAAPAAAQSRGSRTRKVLPRPISLSTSIRPPWLSTIALVMLSPSPTPWIDCSSACRARKKRVNRRSRSAASIPMPVSLTASSTRSAVHEQADADLGRRRGCT